MFDLDLPFPQAIPALADCYETAAAGTFPYVIHFGRRYGDCCAIAILFWLAGAIPDCRATIFLLAGAIHQLPGRNFSLGRQDPSIAAPQFFFLPARSVDCRAAIFLSAGVIHQLPHRNFSFGRRNPLIVGPQFFFWPARSLIAAPLFFFRPARSVDCRAAIFL
jgi:hypothetical protein